MHIAFLTPEYPDLPDSISGGLGTSIQNLASALKEIDEIKVSIIVYDQKKDDFFQKDNLNFHLIAKHNYSFGGWYRYRKHLEKTINHLAETKNIDLIEAPDWTGITAFMKLNVPLVIRLHGSDAYFCKLEGRKQKWKNRWFEKNALKNADHILSVSKFTGSETMKIFSLKRSFEVIPNGVDIKKFKSSGNITNANQLFYFGSLIRKKGFLELAEIFNHLIDKNADIKLIIAGRDVIDIKKNESTWKIFQSRLSAKALRNITYVGMVNYKSIIKKLENSAVVVLPSFAEAFPMTWLEAMAMQKTLVTSDIGWAKEIMLDGDTGFMEHPQNHEKYAEKILQLMENEELRTQIGKQARKKVVEEFSASLIASRNLKFYRRIVNSSGI